MSTLIVKNFISELGKVAQPKTGREDFWLIDPENSLESLESDLGISKTFLMDGAITWDRNNKRFVKYQIVGGEQVLGTTETLPKFVFYPYFDDQGYSHLIYSENKNNKSITIYSEESQKKGKAKKSEDEEIQNKVKAFEVGFKMSWLDRFKGKKIPVEQKYFNDLKDNGPDPNYASLLNFILGKVGQKLKLEPLINIIQKQFQDHSKGFIFKSGGQTLTLNEKDPRQDDFSNVLGINFLTNTIIMSAYQSIPNHSKISLIGTEGNEMFRSEYIAEVNNVPTLKSLIDARPKNTQYFLLSNLHKNHWLLFLIKTEPSLKLEIYDSIPQDSVSEYMDTDVLVEQMNDVFKPIKKFTKKDILIKPTERQKDGYNCGVFTLLQMQKLLNDTKTIFDVSQKEGEEATVKATPASYRMDMLAKIWSSGKFEASQTDQDRLPKLLSNLYIRMLDIPKPDKEQAHFFQEILKAKDSQVVFNLVQLYQAFKNQFPMVDSISKTDSKSQVLNITDSLTSGLSQPMKERLRKALVDMRNDDVKLINLILDKRVQKVGSDKISELLRVDQKQVDELFAFNKKNTANQTATWLNRFDANQRINMYNSLPQQVSISIDDDDADFAFASKPQDFKKLKKAEQKQRAAEEAERVAREADKEEKSESKKNEEEEEEDEYDDLVDIKEKLEELSDIASKKKYKCERECILRISDKLFREFASKVEQLNPEKIKTFSIYEILNGKNDSSSSSTIQSRLESKIKEAKLQDVLEKAALVPTLARVISILE